MEAARQRLDAWVREVIEWHFDPATGCPFWLDWAAKAGFAALSVTSPTASTRTPECARLNQIIACRFAFG